MKTLLTFSLVFSVIVNYGQGKTTSNNEAVRIFIEEVWNMKDFNKLETLLADTTAFHVNNFYAPNGNTETTASSINEWYDAFPDFKYSIQQIIGEGDFVATYLRFTGTQKAKFIGIESLGNKIDVSEMMLFRFKNKRIIEIWTVWDVNTMKAQMLKKP